MMTFLAIIAFIPFALFMLWGVVCTINSLFRMTLDDFKEFFYCGVLMAIVLAGAFLACVVFLFIKGAIQ